jgi:small conductance mechanosensitive channel
VGISYDTDLPVAIKTLMAVLKQDERILDDPAPFVGVSGFGDSSIDLVVRPWVPLAQYWDIYFDLQIAIKRALDDADIEIPFPQRVVHMKDGGN